MEGGIIAFISIRMINSALKASNPEEDLVMGWLPTSVTILNPSMLLRPNKDMGLPIL